MDPEPTDPLTVLHLDDDPEYADLTATFLQRIADTITIKSATSTSDGLEIISNSHIDCIVSDYQMPDQTGIEFLETVRQDHPDIPFILFTGRGSEEVASEAISAGVNDYLQKGGGTDVFDVLLNRIQNAVAQHRAETLVDRAFRAMDRSREGMALLDEQGNFLYVNEAYTDIVRYDKSELLGESWKLVYPDEQVNRIYEDILDEVPESSHWTGDTVYQRKDGKRILVNHALVYSEEGTMICLIREVSNAEQHQTALREERERFALFVDAVEEYAIFILDPEGYITTWNQGAERIKGYTEDEILGIHFSVFYPDEAREAGQPEMLLEQAQAAGSVTDEGWRVRSDGSQFWADVTITALTDEHGTLRGFGKVTRDLTERRDREAELQQIQAQLDTLPDIFYLVDTDGRVKRYNEQMIDVTGYSESELESMDALELLPPEEREQFQAEHERLQETDEVLMTESWLVSKDGHRTPYEFVRRRLTDQVGEVIGFVGIGRDITEHKEYERRLEQHVDRLNEFGSVLTHDLRNPLNVAKGRLNTLAPSLNEEQAEHADTIARSLDRMETIIDDVLEITRTGLPVTNPEQTDFSPLIERTWADLETGTTHATLSTEAIPNTVVADPSLLQRLLMNLFRNAIEYGDTHVNVRVGGLGAGFYVEDDGIGIPEADREQVFDWKYSTKEGGSGIGLKSVQQIVDAHGWAIRVTEGTDGGARFEVTGVDIG